MKKGFTIIELLVASLLLGILVTILTMIFNQSSIAWRTGVASTADLGDARRNIAQIREEADNAFVCNNQTHMLLGLWTADGQLRTRACDQPYSAEGVSKLPDLNDNDTPLKLSSLSVGGDNKGHSLKSYTVNVMSAGPDKVFETYDDIWSYPDDFE